MTDAQEYMQRRKRKKKERDAPPLIYHSVFIKYD